MRTNIASPRHPSTARLARELFASIGSEVDDQDPAHHDEHMALTHAMAFFIARGLLDLGVSDELGWTPPSFAALAASIAAVRADAGHLFQAIQRENPYAAAIRGRLIEALSNIDRQLAMVPTQDGTAIAPRIPNTEGVFAGARRGTRTHRRDRPRADRAAAATPRAQRTG